MVAGAALGGEEFEARVDLLRPSAIKSKPGSIRPAKNSARGTSHESLPSWQNAKATPKRIAPTLASISSRLLHPNQPWLRIPRASSERKMWRFVKIANPPSPSANITPFEGPGGETMGFHCSDCVHSSFEINDETGLFQGTCSRGYTLTNPHERTSPEDHFAPTPNGLFPTVDPFGKEYLRTSNVCGQFVRPADQSR